jgi:D-alanine-D-alanine ligase
MTAPESLKVALLAGGRSSEHEVSLASGQAVREGLLAGGHEVLWVEISREGIWTHQGERLQIGPGEGLLGADVVFPVLHGPFGEDGTVQGVLETLDVAYVGAGVAASAMCMDKVLFKGLMTACEVPQVDYVGVRAERWQSTPEAVLAELADLGLPVFVKPAHLGSSVGIVKVGDAAELTEALDGAFVHDSLVIVEAMAIGIEVECAVLGRPRAERMAVAADLGLAAAALACEPGEVVFQGDWYDYEAKYTPGGMQLVIPARIPAEVRERVRELAVEVFAYTGCEGLARVDFFVEDRHVLVNELNTMPGFTPTSVYAKLTSAEGIDYPEVVDRLCRLALERHAERRAHAY